MFSIPRTLRAMVLTALMTLPYLPQASAADEHPGRYLASNCTGCHGTQGRSVGAIPKLAGLEKAYIVNAMKEYKSGTKQATIMHQHAKGYSEADVETIAEYFAAQRAQ